MNTQKEKILFEGTPLNKVFLKLALPAVLGQIVIVIYNIADTFFIGLTGNDAKLTAITVCMPAFMFLSAISNLFGIGGCSTISRALGKNNRKRASQISSFAIWSSIFTTILYIVFLIFFMDNFINWLGGKNSLVHIFAKNYLYITVILGGIFTVISNVLSHLVRAEGNGFKSGFGVILGGIMNIILDPLFMFVILKPGNEILGAAIATMLSNLISMIFFIIVIYKNRFNSVLSFSIKNFSIKNKIATDVLSVGLPACTMTIFENISYAVLDNLLCSYGLLIQTGIGVAKKINMLAHSIVRGMTQGMMPLISYNYSCKNISRMKQSVNLTLKISVICSFVCMIISLIFAEPLVEIFIQSGSEAIIFGKNFLRILCLGGPFSAFAYGCISFFQAVGMGKKSFVLAIMRKGIIDIPMMFILNHFLSFYGTIYATPLADGLCCIVSLILITNFMNEPEKETQKVFNICNYITKNI